MYLPVGALSLRARTFTVLFLLSSPAPRVIAAEAAPNWYDISSRSTVRDSWNQVFAPSSFVPMDWTGDVESNQPGATSQAFKTAVAARINWFRAMAGVPAVITLDETFNARDQQAALMISANRAVSHYPPPAWVDYSDEGAEAAAYSNLCFGYGAYTDPGCVLLYMTGQGANNFFVEHRRWILFPQTRFMGTGDVSQSGTAQNPYPWANALWVNDGRSVQPRPATRNAYVAWPPPGYVPYQVVGARWSFSYPGADFTNASVSMKRNGAAVPVRLEPVGSGHGEETVVWVPDNLNANTAFQPVPVAADTESTVTLSNVLVSGAAKEFTYSVTVFDPTTGVGPLGPPAVSSLSPPVSSGGSQTIGVTFSAPGGYGTLDVVNVLINDYLDGRQACYLAYSRPSNTLYIVADSGDASQLSGKVMNGAGTLENSQCVVQLNGSSAGYSGTLLTLTLNLTFASSFGGNKVIYAAARDASGNNSGWQTVGVHGVPPLASSFPNPVGMSPSSGAALTQTVTFTYQDQFNPANLQTVWALINTAIDGRGACYVAYYRPGNLLYLYPDNGDGTQATNVPLAGSNSIANSQCTISAQGSSVQTSGNTLALTLPVTFKTPFAGFKGVWLAAQTLGGAQTSAWQALGAWTVPGQ